MTLLYQRAYEISISKYYINIILIFLFTFTEKRQQHKKITQYKHKYKQNESSEQVFAKRMTFCSEL